MGERRASFEYDWQMEMEEKETCLTPEFVALHTNLQELVGFSLS